jgi:hypothetical protein
MLRKRFSCTPYICLLKKKIGSTFPKKKKSSMIEGILCQTRKSPRSILGVCEERFIAGWCKIHQSERFFKKK